MLKEPLSLEQDLVRLEQLLYALSENFPDKIRADTSAKIAYTVAYSDAQDEAIHQATTEGKKEPAEWKADLAAELKTKDLYKAHLEAAAEVEIDKKKISIYSDILSSCQSRVKLELAERGASGMTT